MTPRTTITLDWSLCPNQLRYQVSFDEIETRGSGARAPIFYHWFFSSSCTNCVAATKRTNSARRRYWSYCRLHVDQRHGQIVETSQSWSTKNCQWCSMRGSLSTFERYRSALLLRPRRTIQCLRWHSRQCISYQTKRQTNFGRYRIVWKYLARLWQPHTTWIRSYCRIHRLGRQ